MQQSLDTVLWCVTQSPFLPLKFLEDQNQQQKLGLVFALRPLQCTALLQTKLHLFQCAPTSAPQQSEGIASKNK